MDNLTLQQHVQQVSGADRIPAYFTELFRIEGFLTEVLHTKLLVHTQMFCVPVILCQESMAFEKDVSPLSMKRWLVPSCVINNRLTILSVGHIEGYL